MTIMSEQHALKFVCRQIRKKGDAIGSADRPFLDEIFAGRSPSKNEIHLLLGGVDQGVDRNQLFVAARDEFGGLVTVDLFDCSKAEEVAIEPEVPPKRTLDRLEVLPLVCAMLEERCNASGLIVTPGRNMEVLIDELLAELNKEYEVCRQAVQGAFDGLFPLGLRGDAKRLRLSGMFFNAAEAKRIFVSGGVEEVIVSESELQKEVTALQDRVQRLQTANDSLMARAKLLSEENGSLLEEKQILISENTSLKEMKERQSQAIADLRTSKAALVKFENAVRIASEEYDENK